MNDIIRQRMLEMTLTQAALAKKVGMSPAALSNIFNNKAQPRLSTIRRLVGALSTSELDAKRLMSSMTSHQSTSHTLAAAVTRVTQDTLLSVHDKLREVCLLLGVTLQEPDWRAE